MRNYWIWGNETHIHSDPEKSMCTTHRLPFLSHKILYIRLSTALCLPSLYLNNFWTFGFLPSPLSYWKFISPFLLHLLPASSTSFLSFFFMLIFICPSILWFPFETLFHSQDCVFILVNNLWILIHPTFKNCVHLLSFVHWNPHMMYLRPSEWMKLSLCLPKPW